MISNNASIVLNERYFLPGEDWEKLCKRISKAISDEETDLELKKEYRKKYFDLIYNLKFLPNSPTLMNAGKPDGQLSACFVLEIEDNMESIMSTLKYTGLIHKSGGGTGFSFNSIRPKGDSISSTSGTAPGPVSFIKMYDGVTEYIKQGGSRRGANIAILRVDHPDILEFIDCKQELNKINNFNISVAITDKFMDAVKHNKAYNLVFNNKTYKTLNAREVFDKIVSNSYATGEPGLFFIDAANNNFLYGTCSSTNPCGEQPLRNWESCNLGSFNLVKYYNNNIIDLSSLKEDIRTATRMLDSIISINNYPINKIKDTTLETRKIGLGIMGYADLLIKLGHKYGSEEALQAAKNIMEYISVESKKYSEELGKEKGVCEACKKLNIKRRNLMTTTIAPTGTLSIIADCSSGCEPLFSVAYRRNCMDGKVLKVINPIFIEMLEKEGIPLTNKLTELLLESSSIQELDEIPKNIRDLFLTTPDITPEQHIQTQAAFQTYVDSAVSKTVNLPNKASKKDVEKIYLLAHELSCKGITVYRDGCRPNQVLSNKKEGPSKRKRGKKTYGFTEKISTPLGSCYITINKNKDDDLAPIEMFIQLGKTGGSIKSFTEAIAKLISRDLKRMVPPHEIAKAIIGIKSEDGGFDSGTKFSSIPDLIGKKLLEVSKEQMEDDDIEICPVCDSKLIRQEGCLKCTCGFSKC